MWKNIYIFTRIDNLYANVVIRWKMKLLMFGPREGLLQHNRRHAHYHTIILIVSYEITLYYICIYRKFKSLAHTHEPN